MASHGRAVFHDGVGLKLNFASTNTLTFDIAAEPTATWRAIFPANPPSVPSVWAVGADGTISYQPLGGGGTVTSFSAGDLAPLFTTSEATPSTTPALSFSLTNQSANRFFAGPTTGVDAAPTFRALVYSDISALVGTGASNIAAGNDSRLHTQNTDTGTTSAGFQLDSGNGGPQVRNESAALAVRNAANNAYADIIVRNLTVQGTTTTVNSTTVDIADNIITLNSDFTAGTPTENTGIRALRGASTTASLRWNEATDKWESGVEGTELPIARQQIVTFTNATLVSGVLAASHTLDNQWPNAQVFDNNNRVVGPDEMTGTSSSVFTVDLTTFGAITGTWRLVLNG